MRRGLLFVMFLAAVMLGFITGIALHSGEVGVNSATVANQGVYFFYLDSCPHCQNVKPFVDEVSKYVNITYCNMNELSGDCKNLADFIGIRFVPCIVIIDSKTFDFVMLAGENAIKKLPMLINLKEVQV